MNYLTRLFGGLLLVVVVLVLSYVINKFSKERQDAKYGVEKQTAEQKREQQFNEALQNLGIDQDKD